MRGSDMYKIINDNLIQRLGDGAVIPRDEANKDYQEFLEWERAGGAIEPADPKPVYVPQEVSASQAYAALMGAGLFEQVEAWAADPATNPLHRLAFQKGTTFRRDSPALLAGAVALQWSDAMLDQLFVAADAIRM